MNIKIQRGNLLEGLNNVGKAITNNSNQSILQGVYMKTSSAGMIFRGTDLNLSVTTLVNADIISPGQLVVDYKIFNEVIRKLPNAEIEISVVENYLEIKCKKSKFEIVIMSNVNDYPELPNMKSGVEVTLLQSTLKDMVRSTGFAISHDESRPILQGMLFEVKDKQLSIVGLDGYRLAIRTEPIECEQNIEVVVSGSNFIELSKILKDSFDEVKIKFTDNQICFDLGNTIIISRLLEGKYVNYRQLTGKSNIKISSYVNRTDFLNSLERATLMSKSSDNTNLVKLSVSDSSIVISSNSNMGKVRDEVKATSSCEETMEIAFNSKYLIDILKNTECEEIEMKFQGPEKPCLINPKNNCNTTYLVLPVRLK